jgi:hypothetical protein
MRTFRRIEGGRKDRSGAVFFANADADDGRQKSVVATSSFCARAQGRLRAKTR